MSWNDHIRQQVGERRGGNEVDRINDSQRSMIVKRDDPDMTEEDRWVRIYKTIFRCKPNVSPYLTEGLGLKLSLLHDYWSSSRGEDCVRRYLSDQGHIQAHQEDWSSGVRGALFFGVSGHGGHG